MNKFMLSVVMGFLTLADPAAFGDSLNIWNGGVVINSGDSTIKLGDNTGTPRTSLVVGSTTSGVLQLSKGGGATNPGKLELTGNWSELTGGVFNNTSGTYPSNLGATVTFNGDGQQTITVLAANNFPNLTVTNSAATPSTTNMVKVLNIGAGNDILIKGNVAITDGWFGVDGAQAAEVTIGVNGSIVVGDTTTDAANEESLYLACNGVNAATLDFDAPTAATAVLFFDLAQGGATANFTGYDMSKYPPAGLIVIGGEIMRYTGNNGTELSGLTRGLYPNAGGQPDTLHAAGSSAFVPLLVDARSADDNITFNGGRIDLIGSSSARAKIYRNRGALYYYNFAAGGTFNASWYQLANLADEGIMFGPRARILDLNHGSFQGISNLAGAAYMNLVNLDGGDRLNVVPTADECQFDDPDNGTDPDPKNIHAGGSTPLINFMNYSGDLSGEASDWDDWDRVTWAGTAASGKGSVGRYLAASPTVLNSRYDSIQAALNACAAGDIVRPLYNMIHTESNVTIPVQAPNIVLERFMWRPTSGRAISNAAAEGTIRNCIFASGDAAGVAVNNVEIVDNCTLLWWDGRSAALTVSGGTKRNTIEQRASGASTGPDANKNVTMTAGDASSCFQNFYDAHISNTGATPTALLLDKGLDLSASFTTDWEGNTRTGTWDIGADESFAAARPTAIYKPATSGAWAGRVMWTIPNLSRSTKGFYSLVGGGSASGTSQDFALVLWSQTGTMIQSLALGGEPVYALMMPDGAGDYKIILILDLGNSSGAGTGDGIGDSVAIISDNDEDAVTPLSFDAAFTSFGPAGPSGAGSKWLRNDVIAAGKRWYGNNANGGIRKFNLLNSGAKRWGYVVSKAADATDDSVTNPVEMFFKIDPMPAGGNPLSAEIAGGIPWNEKSGLNLIRGGGKIFAGRNTAGSELNRLSASTLASEAATTNTAGGVNDIGSMSHTRGDYTLEHMFVLPNNNIVYRRKAGTMGNPDTGWADSQNIGAQKDSLPYPPVWINWLWGGAVGRLYKVDLTDGNVVNGNAESGEEGNDWPVTFDGSVSTEIGWFGTRLMWGTTAGECWIVTALSEYPAVASNDGMNGIVGGFPYRIPQRQITSRHYNFQATPKKVMYSTNWGEVYEFNVP